MDIYRELLLGVFAVRSRFVDSPQLTDAIQSHVGEPKGSLADVLLERELITAAQKDQLTALVDQELQRHGGDADAALDAVVDADERRMLSRLNEPQLQRRFGQTQISESAATGATVAYKPHRDSDLAVDGTVRIDPTTTPTVDGRVDDEDEKHSDGHAKTEESAESGFTVGLSFVAPSGPQYTLKDLHGEGGLGRVWLARDADLNREVALKELQPDRITQPDVMRGFLKEAQITGQLEHPNIVPVYQLSRSPKTGKPFYTMRLIRGNTFLDAIAEYHHRKRQGDATRLEQRRLLSAFASVCNAIAFAHSRGVIHRDLKPENVVLGDFGQVIVLDWGLAKLLGQDDDDELERHQVAITDPAKSDATVAGTVMGTPAYMAPEQGLGEISEIDSRTDVYGLGAMLFHLLAGQAPHRGKNMMDVLRDVVTNPTPSPRSDDPTVPAALDAIAAKAMQEKPDERYGSASDLAQDVEKWLADEPVSVFREPWHTRAARWARRHKTLVAGTAVLLVTAVVGLSVSTVLIRQEQQHTETARQRAVTNFRRAEANFQQAREAVNYMLTKFGEENLADVPEMQLLRQTLLEKALSFYRGFLEEKPEDPSVQFETARAYYRVGEISLLLQRHADAQQAYEKAIDLFQSLVDQFPQKPKNRQLLANSQSSLGELFRTTGKLEQAESAYGKAQQLQQALSQQFPNVADYRLELARTFYSLGLALHASNRMQPAEDAYNQAIGSLQRLVDSDSQSEQYRQELARAQINLGMLLRNARRGEDAGHAYERAIALLSQLVDESPRKREFQHERGTAYMNLGNLLLPDRSRGNDTEDAYRKGLKLFETLARDFPNVPLYRYEWANSVNGLGGFYYFAKEPQQAEERWRQALELFQTLATRYPTIPDYQSRLGATQGNLGSLLLDGDKVLESIKLLQQAIHHQRSALKSNPDNPSYRQFLRNHYWGLSRALNQFGQHAKASQAAAELPRIIPDGWQEHYRAAGLVAQCIAVAAKDKSVAEVERAKIEKRYADQAVEFVRQAVQRGFNNADDMGKNQSLRPLSEHPEFKRLLNQLRNAE